MYTLTQKIQTKSGSIINKPIGTYFFTAEGLAMYVISMNTSNMYVTKWSDNPTKPDATFIEETPLADFLGALQ